ncbi:hypothetical protein JCM11251_004832 [Rhodosporidiobolus azoricus]
MPPKLAMPQMAPMAPSTSRSDPKPVLRASKEWVVPPRPKPGRKSTKTEAEQAKATGRTSQKAFRERRQEYVTELEEKVRSLEAGEGEKCVFYQQQAQKAKAETSALRSENDGLKKIIEQLRRELDGARGKTGGKDKGKGRAAPVEFDEVVSPGPSKRPRRSAAVRAQAVVASAASSSPLPIPSAESPVPALSPPSTTTSSSTSTFAHSPLNDLHPVGPASPHLGRCGFCAAGSDCFCASVGYPVAHTPGAIPISLASPVVKIEETDDMFFGDAVYEPAVPLTLHRSQKKAAPVWSITSATPTVVAKPVLQALCNGDPSNCPACSDDPYAAPVFAFLCQIDQRSSSRSFGKAFCNALSTTVCTTQPCTNCPSNCTSRKMPTPPPETTDEETALFESLTDLPCCGDPALCGSLTCKPNKEVEVIKIEEDAVEMLPKTVDPGVRSVDTVPCNEAWTALKSHPNIAFADLQMLADVVAKRTHCGGPVHSATPPSVPASLPSIDTAFDANRPELVPQSQLQCSIDAGARKRLTVERGAVNEALEMLDRAVARGGPLRQ